MLGFIQAAVCINEGSQWLASLHGVSHMGVNEHTHPMVNRVRGPRATGTENKGGLAHAQGIAALDFSGLGRLKNPTFAALSPEWCIQVAALGLHHGSELGVGGAIVQSLTGFDGLSGELKNKLP
jgi:hypothetical protein